MLIFCFGYIASVIGLFCLVIVSPCYLYTLGIVLVQYNSLLEEDSNMTSSASNIMEDENFDTDAPPPYSPNYVLYCHIIFYEIVSV